jgi:signal transduction histidine kinase
VLADPAGAIWVATTQGLSRLDPSTGRLLNFTEEDGIYNPEFVQWSGFKNTKNELYLGQLGSFLHFDPSLYTPVYYQPPVYLTSFRLFDQKVDFGTPNYALTQIDLTHKDNFFEFEYALLDYQDPANVEYAYIMENLDENWKFVGDRRIASYTNLDAGTYIFKVKAKRGNGSWQEIAQPITIIIEPAWYNTWWFRMLALVLVVSSGLFYYTHKLNTVKRQKEQLEVVVAQRTHELVEKNEEINAQKENIEEQNKRLKEVHALVEERNNELNTINEELEDRVEERTKELKLANEELDTFVYRSYHDIIGPLSRLQGLCYVAALDIKDEAALEYIKRLKENSDEAKATLLKVLSIYNIRNSEIALENTDVLELLHKITAQFDKQLKNIHLEFKYANDFFPMIRTDQELLRLALNNIIENAVKYSRRQPGSYIKILVEKASPYRSSSHQKPHNRQALTNSGQDPSSPGPSSPESGQILRIQVTDNGQGIAEMARHKVFTMFFRADQEKSGMGLGLYLARLAMLRLGGRIYYRHTQLNESNFEILLPLAESRITEPAKSLQKVATS